jgi:hypothetical protein
MSIRRDALQQRLAEELDDVGFASDVVAALDDTIVDGLAERVGADIATSRVLSYRPPRIDDDDVDSLWILAFGYRLAAASTAGVGEVPPMSNLEPGPANEDLAREAASFVARRAVPIIAQWEVAQVLDDLGVPRVISVEPDHAADGSVVYLSTAGVLEKGLRLAADARIEVGQAGLLGHADHIKRCLMTAAAAGMTAGIPEGVKLPTDYDPESGQVWTRSRAKYILVDLMARSLMG